MSVPRILIVEDDTKIARLLCQFLNGEGYVAESVTSGEEAIKRVKELTPDLIVMDLMLPKMDGVEASIALRGFFTGAILMLTAHESEMQEVIALNAGVDDFMNKPVRPHVLKARVNALLRRHSVAPSMLSFAGFQIERETRRAMFGTQNLDLSESEFELLWALASQAGKVVTRDALFQALRCKEYDGHDRSIDMRVSKLRKKLALYSERELIRTLRQVGYIFAGEE